MEEVFNSKKIYQAYLDCRKSKKNKLAHIDFFSSLEFNLYKIEQELLSRTYEVGKFDCFILTTPVIREVFAGNFKDRVVQHILINEIESHVDKYFIFDSFACRKNKGNLLAVRRLQSGIQSSHDKYNKMPYFLQMDVKSFFMSIEQKKLFDLLKKLLFKIKTKCCLSDKWLENVLYLSRVIIFNDPTRNYVFKGDQYLRNKIPQGKSLFHSKKGYGLPIGNLASQFFANVYMNQFDHFVKRILKRQYYYRYVDDFIILGSLKSLYLIEEEIKKYLQQNLGLEINKKKTKIKNCQNGIFFLGYVVRSKYILPQKKNYLKFLHQLKYNPIYSLETINKLNRSYNSFKGYLGHAKSYKMLTHLNNSIYAKSNKQRITISNSSREFNVSTS